MIGTISKSLLIHILILSLWCMAFASSFFLRSTTTKRFRIVPFPSRRFLGMPAAELELEQKFQVSLETTDCLKELGFEKFKERNMVDWYFDFPKFPLMRRDTWLRYRHLVDSLHNGQWQLKSGSGNQKSEQEPTTTIYKEIAGDEALWQVRDLLQENNQVAEEASNPENINLDEGEYEGCTIPIPTIDLPGLTPFARIVTQRSSWKSASNHFEHLTVDLDQTNFGYNVGEVEMLVPGDTREEDYLVLQNAKNKIQALIDQLAICTLARQNQDMLAESVSSTRKVSYTKGKLEYFLEYQKPLIYAIMVDAGLVIP